MKKNGVLNLLVILLVIAFIGCEGSDEPVIYKVTIGTLTNANGSTITANPTSGVEGTEITLTISEDNTYRLKTGTLKYGTTAINETTFKFNLPAENVIITAEFKSFFVGLWTYDGETWIFFDNGLHAVDHGKGYIAKGTWITNGNNKIITTTTHYKTSGYTTIEDFLIKDLIETPWVSTFEILTYSSIKTEAYDGSELVYIKQ